MKSIVTSLILLLFLSCDSQNTSSSKSTTTVFKSVSVIPMDKEGVLQNQDVIVKDGKILAIEETGKIKYEKNVTVIDGKGKFLIPGLAEMHAHVPPSENIQQMKDVLLLYTLKGVTTIRGMLGHPTHLQLRQQLKNGEIVGPHFYTSGPSFNGNSVKSPEAAEAMVSEQKSAGYDFFKLHPGLSLANFDAMAKKAKEVNMRFAGHVSYDVGVWHAIEAGYASIDHLDGFIEALVPGVENIKEQDRGLFALYIATKADVSKIPALTKALRENNIWVVPTQALAERWASPLKSAEAFAKEPEMIYMSEKTLNDWVRAKNNLVKNSAYDSASAVKWIEVRRQLIKACQQDGIGLLSGSDAPQVFDVPGFSLHQELQYMVAAGLTPYEALRSSTVNVAKYFNLTNSGMIKAGNVSDLVLLNGNPLTDISQTVNIEGVMIGNKWLSKDSINTALQSLKGKIAQ